MKNMSSTPSPKVCRDTLKDRICSELKRMILMNKLKPGQVLVIDQLAEVFGVSHTPVREALAMMALEGFIELNSYQNPRVADVTEKDVVELYEMRLLVEPWAIERATMNLTERELEEVQQQLEKARDGVLEQNYEMHLKSDIYFHTLIFNSTHNDFFLSLANRVNEQSIRVRSLAEADSTPQSVLQIINEHFEIVDAIRARDGDLARTLMIKHLKAGRERTLTVIKGWRKQMNEE